MSNRGLRACIRKELLLLSRDLHGLALLFLMPLAFILIMSLALQNQFAERSGEKLRVLLQDDDRSDAALALAQSLGSSDAFAVQAAAAELGENERQAALRRGEYAFAVTIAAGFGAGLTSREPQSNPTVIVTVAPDTTRQTEAIFVATLRAGIGAQRLRALFAAAGVSNLPAETATGDELKVQYAYRQGAAETTPTAVQQSVPAWLVFAVFFVVVPLSNTLIRERQLGTLRRLRSTNVGGLTILLGKLIPYFVVNQLQVVLMLLAGRFLVPALGGDALHINGSPWVLAAIAASLSIAALGVALLIAVASTTTEQATLLGGTGNIVLAAVGGIMVPKFIMPATMQSIADWSPMSWGLEGFLDVLLRGGGWRAIAPEAACLTALGLAAILLAWGLQQRRVD